MGFQLEKVIPWGRSLNEYIKMFNLTPDDLQLKILDCAGGPSSFNAEMTRQGHKVISCDPVYQVSAEEISQRIQETYSAVVEGVRANSENFVWQDIPSPEALGQMRMVAMQQFLEDFPLGREEGRYLPDELPELRFTSGEFDLALCGHFLFSYSDHLSAEFHLAAILEMCRVAKEVRVFPILKTSGEISPFLEPIMKELEVRRYGVKLSKVAYEFQKDGNQMLQILSI